MADKNPPSDFGNNIESVTIYQLENIGRIDYVVADSEGRIMNESLSYSGETIDCPELAKIGSYLGLAPASKKENPTLRICGVIKSVKLVPIAQLSDVLGDYFPRYNYYADQVNDIDGSYQQDFAQLHSERLSLEKRLSEIEERMSILQRNRETEVEQIGKPDLGQYLSLLFKE
jgi:hypothetical protein